MRRVKTAILFASLIAGSLLLAIQPKVVSANVQDKLRTYQKDKARNALLSENAASDDKAKVLRDLAAELAKTGLRPSADLSEGTFGDELPSGEIQFIGVERLTRTSAFSERIRAVAQVLGASAAGQTGVCFDSPGSVTERFSVDGPSEALLIKALEAEGITPIPLNQVKMNGRVMLLSEARLGSDLFSAFRKRADEGATTVSLSLNPLPEWEAVRLSLKTTDGQKITVPVELDGAARKLEISDKTRWVLDGQQTDIPFDQGAPHQRVVLADLMKRGELSFTNIVKADHYPIHKRIVDESRQFDFNLVGTNDVWLGRATHDVKISMSVQKGPGACALSVRFTSAGSGLIDLGYLPPASWNALTSAKAVGEGDPRPLVAYATAPQCESGGVGLSGDAFDNVMARPRRCAKLCEFAALYARGLPAVQNASGTVLEVAAPALNFSTSVCEKTCLERSAYKQCLEESVRGEARGRYMGLLRCEERRRLTK